MLEILPRIQGREGNPVLPLSLARVRSMHWLPQRGKGFTTARDWKCPGNPRSASNRTALLTAMPFGRRSPSFIDFLEIVSDPQCAKWIIIKHSVFRNFWKGLSSVNTTFSVTSGSESFPDHPQDPERNPGAVRNPEGNPGTGIVGLSDFLRESLSNTGCA